MENWDTGLFFFTQSSKKIPKLHVGLYQLFLHTQLIYFLQYKYSIYQNVLKFALNLQST